MRRIFLSIIIAGLSSFSVAAWAQSSACDLNNDGKVDSADVQLATNMTLGASSCTANVAGTGICNVVMVQRVINAAMGGTCVTGSLHSVSLSWAVSTSSNVVGYNIYRATASGGPYTRLTSAPVAGTSFNDQNVQSGSTYFYAATAVDNTSSESAMSSQASAVVPVP